MSELVYTCSTCTSTIITTDYVQKDVLPYRRVRPLLFTRRFGLTPVVLVPVLVLLVVVVVVVVVVVIVVVVEVVAVVVVVLVAVKA